MSLTPSQVTALAAELKNDPSGLGCAPFLAINDYLNLVFVLNFVRDGVTPCPANGVVGAAITGVRVTSVSQIQILGAVAAADLITNGIATQPTADQAGKLMLFQALVNQPSGQIALTNSDGTDNNNAKNLKQVVANGSASKTALAALETRNGSRSEQLFAVSGTPAGVVVSAADVQAAIATGNA